MQVVAVSKSVRQTPRKIALVASLVRGRSVADAIVILEHTPKRAAIPVRKTIESAAANATNNHNLDKKTLQIADLEIGPAPSLKRYRPAAHGRAQPYLRRSTNIRVVVEGTEKAKKKSSVKKTDSKKTDAKVAETKKTESKNTEEKTEKEAPTKKRGFLKRSDKSKSATFTKQRTGRRGDR